MIFIIVISLVSFFVFKFLMVATILSMPLHNCSKSAPKRDSRVKPYQSMYKSRNNERERT